MEIEQKGGYGKKFKKVQNDAPVQFNNVTIFSSLFIPQGGDQGEYLFVPADALIKNFYIWK